MDPKNYTQTVVITGAGSGIGYAIAERFFEDGANLLMVGRTEAKLVNAAKRLVGALQRVAILAGDITIPATAMRIVNAAQDRFGRVDVFVNNAKFS